jgi:hypothetical protein
MVSKTINIYDKLNFHQGDPLSKLINFHKFSTNGIWGQDFSGIISAVTGPALRLKAVDTETCKVRQGFAAKI